MKNSASFVVDQLASCLLGNPSTIVDWEPVLTLANNSLLTPAMWSSILERGQLGLLPEDVASFLSFIHRCNVERNERLRAQLEELVATMNAAGIIPTLTKGAALLAQAKAERSTARIMRDLDLVVEDNERQVAEKCLVQLGYAPIEAFGWGRPKDVGAVDLHYPPGRYPSYWPSNATLAQHRREIDVGRARAHILSTTLQAQHWIVHDMLKDGHLWRFHIDLRNLFELYLLSKSPDKIDWKELDILLSDPLGRSMLYAQISALNAVFGADIAEAQAIPAWLGLHHQLRRNEYHPQLGGLIRSFGRVAWGIRVAQIHWRFRGPWGELPGRIIRKGQKVITARVSQEI
ncbi:nucleotidyltransferase family protein [Rhizobium rhizogenes]|uniref:nucleotidyltransferase family protein n=1 Tax=Rhizobium rhizogenes TaxID=359 RepID=UPI003ECDA45D